MRLQFLGASQTVTGSRYLITNGSGKVMIDCGLFQGLKALRLKNWETFAQEPSTIDAIILTHAHLDHSGYLPLLVKNGFSGPIYCTAPTAELCRILLMDSAHLQEEEARFANRHGYSKHSPALPLYTRGDVEQALRLFRPVPVHRIISVTGEMEFSLFTAGHLLGATSVRLTTRGRSLLFSGDLGRPMDPLMPAPEPPPNSDYLIMESTYGDRRHAQTDPRVELLTIVNETVGRGGTVLIPSFAVGRAQLILYYLMRLRDAGQLPPVKIYLNSPMASQVNKVFCRFAREQRLPENEIARLCRIAEVVDSVDDSKALNENDDPKIVIAASGMATGGRVLHHLKRWAPEAKNSIVFAGFQVAGTRGEAMVHGCDEIKIHGEMWPVNASVHNLESLSAHADSDELINWVAHMKAPPAQAFVTHGEPQAASALRLRLKSELNIPATVPSYQASFDL